MDGDDVGVEDAHVVEDLGHEVAREDADHEDLAVGEVDHAHDPVDHRVAQRDEGVDAALDGAVDDQVDPGRRP